MLNAATVVARARAPGNVAPPDMERMLLVEPNLVACRTLTTVIRELGMARVEEAADAAGAARHMEDTCYTALLIDLCRDQEAALALITRLRHRQTACAPRMPVVAMAATADPAMQRRLTALDAKLLVRPFKVRAVLELLRSFQSGAAANVLTPSISL